MDISNLRRSAVIALLAMMIPPEARAMSQTPDVPAVVLSCGAFPQLSQTEQEIICERLLEALRGKFGTAVRRGDRQDAVADEALFVSFELLQRQPDFLLSRLRWTTCASAGCAPDTAGPTIETSVSDALITPETYAMHASSLVAATQFPVDR